MQQKGRPWVRAAIATGGVLLVLASGAGIGSLTAQASNQPAASAAPTPSKPIAAKPSIGSSAIVAPEWCCPGTGSSASGLTVTGQATVHGQDKQARDSAIAQAVADAKDQATAAAEAAGVTLGKILSLQVSASGYPYPLEATAGDTGVTAPMCKPEVCSSAGEGVACPNDTFCRATVVPVETFASATITWEIS